MLSLTLELLGGAKSEEVVGLLDVESPAEFIPPPNKLLDVAFDELSGFLKLNKEPLPAPVLAPGGGPAGVVEFPNNDVVCLLVGVVLISLESGLLPNRPPTPGAGFPPNVFVTGWGVAGVPAGLFGVEKRDVGGAPLAGGAACETGCEDPNIPPVVALVVVGGPKEKEGPPVVLLAAPNIGPPLLAPPKGELAAGPLVLAPNNEPDGADEAGVLPKSDPPVVDGAATADPNGLLSEAAALVLGCPNSPVPASGREAWLNVNGDAGLGGSAILSWTNSGEVFSCDRLQSEWMKAGKHRM